MADIYIACNTQVLDLEWTVEWNLALKFLFLNSTLIAYWFLILFSNRRKQGSWEKWLILGLEQEIYKISLKHFVLPESKEALTTNKNAHIYLYNDGVMSKDTEITGRTPNGQSWKNFSTKINKIIVDYNPEYKINIHKPIPVQKSWENIRKIPIQGHSRMYFTSTPQTWQGNKKQGKSEELSKPRA